MSINENYISANQKNENAALDRKMPFVDGHYAP
jgi:hypothetical protein